MTNGEHSLLDQDLLLSQDRKVPLDAVRAWMASDSLEVQGRVYALLTEQPGRLEMPPVEEREDFYLRYLEACLRDDSEGDYALGRYQAGRSAGSWFERLWRERPATEWALQKLRDLLARLSAADDAGVRDAVMTTVLEHLFQNPAIADFFGEWSRDPALAPVYSEALTLAGLWNKKAPETLEADQ